jgi:hypothetical protein
VAGLATLIAGVVGPLVLIGLNALTARSGRTA